MTRHPLIAILLALVLAAGTILSGPVLAHPTGTAVELCVEGQTVTVTLDAQGNPAPAHRPCPLCLAAQDLALTPALAAWAGNEKARPAIGIVPPEPPAFAAINPVPPARAPPLPV